MNPDDFEMQAMMDEHARLHAENMARMEQQQQLEHARYQQLMEMAQQQVSAQASQVFGDGEMESIKERLLEAAMKKDAVKRDEEHFDEELFTL
jgi:hypothetical protein